MSQDFSCKKTELSSTWPHGVSQKYTLINHKQSILYYTRPPCDFHLIKVIGHASFASPAVFLSFLHLSPHLHALEQQRDSWTQVQRRFTQHPPSREHLPYANCKHAADTSCVINFGFRRPSLIVPSAVFRLWERRTWFQRFIPYDGLIVCPLCVENQCILSRR